MPLVVLVDETSYSASEIFAGVIQEHKRGKIVGVTTGGSVELTRYSLFRQQNHDVLFAIAEGRITLAISGVNLDGRGVRPDFFSILSKEDVLLGKDTQLEAALYVLKKEIRSRR
jgi:carboxyl-terminal processing protease